MWTTKDATLIDAAYVFDHVWERGAIELAGFDVTRDRWLDACIEMIAAKRCVVFECDGATQALLGLLDTQTWFQAVGAVDMLGLTRHMRRALDDLAARWRARTVDIVGLCVSPDAPRWYGVLGFTEDNSYDGHVIAGRRERHFVRRWA